MRPLLLYDDFILISITVSRAVEVLPTCGACGTGRNMTSNSMIRWQNDILHYHKRLSIGEVHFATMSVFLVFIVCLSCGSVEIASAMWSGQAAVRARAAMSFMNGIVTSLLPVVS